MTLRRLREEVGSQDARLARAGELLRAARPAAPPPAPPKDRVRAAVERRIRAAGRPSPFRPTIAIVALAGAAAAAALGARALHGRRAPAVALGAPGAVAVAVAAPVAVAVAVPAPVPAPAPAPPRRRIAVKAPPAPPPPVPAAPVTAAPPAAPNVPPAAPSTEDQAAILLAAAQALRHDHDAARAARLCDDYLQRFPDGDLVEEALELDIEAAGALGDPRAAALARSYLARFPGGQYTPTARAALARFGGR